MSATTVIKQSFLGGMFFFVFFFNIYMYFQNWAFELRLWASPWLFTSACVFRPCSTSDLYTPHVYVCLYTHTVIFAVETQNNVKTPQRNKCIPSSARMTSIKAPPELQRPRFLADRARACAERKPRPQSKEDFARVYMGFKNQKRANIRLFVFLLLIACKFNL